MSEPMRQEGRTAGSVGPAPLDEQTIKALVDSFYAKVRRDPQLGPVFDRAIGNGGRRTCPPCTGSGPR